MPTGGQVEPSAQLKAVPIECNDALNLTRLHSNIRSSRVDLQASH